MKKAPLKAAASLLNCASKSIEKRIENLKQLFLLLTGSAGNKLKKDLINEQEIVMNLSDILTEIFVLESTFLRAEKAKENKNDKAEIFAKITNIQAYDAFENVRKSAREVINAYTTGLENKIMKKFLNNLVPDYNINAKENRREIAKHFNSRKRLFD